LQLVRPLDWTSLGQGTISLTEEILVSIRVPDKEKLWTGASGVHSLVAPPTHRSARAHDGGRACDWRIAALSRA